MTPRGATIEREPRAAAGFTLIELMVVIAIIGIVMRVALLNLGALVPATTLDGESKGLRAHIDFLRSEARLRGQTHSLELDLSNHRFRYVLPPERRLASHEAETEEWPLTWRPLDKRVKFHGLAIPGRPVIEHGIYRVQFDEAGQTGDLAIFLRLDSAAADYVWSLQLHGLTGRSEIKKSIEGHRQALEETNESAF